MHYDLLQISNDLSKRVSMEIHVASEETGIKVEHLQKVSVSSNTEGEIEQLVGIVKPQFNRCYHNSASVLVLMNSGHYVLGYAQVNDGLIPHAWIEHDGKHIDVTPSITNFDGYFKVKQFSIDELWGHLDSHSSVPPEVSHLSDEYFHDKSIILKLDQLVDFLSRTNH